MMGGSITGREDRCGEHFSPHPCPMGDGSRVWSLTGHMAMGLRGGEKQVEPKAAGQRWMGPEQRKDGTKSYRERN